MYHRIERRNLRPEIVQQPRSNEHHLLSIQPSLLNRPSPL